MYHFEYYGYTKAQLEKRGIYGAFEENNYLKVVPDMMDAYKGLGLINGETASEDLVNKIFKEFCMGK